MMTNLVQKWYAKLSVSLDNQKGAQAIEWIALAGVILAVFAAIQTVFKDDTAVGGAVSSTLSKIIKSIAE
jgi:Flp pilus assembly pilin Flp